jgi:methionyl-tRNA formyltransferase
MGVDAILESVALIQEGKAPRIPQPEEGATYEPPCSDRVASISWEKPANQIYNLIRGCDPQPGAYAYWQGEKIRFYGARLLEETSAEAPGTIVQVDSQGIKIALDGGLLAIGKVRSQTGGKVAAAEFASERGLKEGDRFSEEAQ